MRKNKTTPIEQDVPPIAEGPRALKDPYSVDFAWQTVRYMRTIFAATEASLENWERAKGEAERYRIYERIPPDRPYGSLDALIAGELGLPLSAADRDMQQRAPMSHSEAGRRGGRGHKAMGNSQSFSGGHDRRYELGRLQRDRPDLYAQVEAGHLTAHAAAIEAGFRQRPVYMPLDPPALAKAIKKHLSPEDIETLCALLHA